MIRTANERTGRSITMVNLGEGRCLRRRTASKGAKADNFTRQLRESFASRGYDVQLNRPYAGGFITEHHGRPGRGVHSVQLEINRCLYLDERTLRENQGFNILEADLMAIAADLFAALPQLFEHRAAAE